MGWQDAPVVGGGWQSAPVVNQPTAAGNPAAPTEEPSFVDQLKRQAGLTLRMPIDAAMAIPLAGAEFLHGAKNLVTGGNSSAMRAYDDTMGGVFGKPETGIEKGVNLVGTTVLGSKLPGPNIPGGAPEAFQSAPKQIGRLGELARSLSNRFLPGGARRIADNEWDKIAGDADSKQALRNAIVGAKEYVAGSKPTAAQALADTPEGLPIIAMERKLSAIGNGERGVKAPSVRFKINKLAQESARKDAEVARDAVTIPIMKESLKTANETTQKFDDLGERIVDRFYSKASALQTKGGFETLGAQMESGSKGLYPKPDGPVAAKVAAKLGKKAGTGEEGIGFHTVKGAPKVPPRYTPHAAVAKEAASASDDTAAIIATRQSELSAAERELAALEATGAKPMQMDALQQKIAGLRDKPGNYSDDVIRKTMDSLSKKVRESVEKFGRLDADELYKIRKNLGQDIEASYGDNVKPNRKFNAILERDIQVAFDDTIEAAGAKRWKEYLGEYSKRSQAIEDDVSRSEKANEVASRVTMGLYDHLGDHGGTGISGLVGHNVWMANAAMRAAGKRLTPKVATEMTTDALEPQRILAALERMMEKQGRGKAMREFTNKYGATALANALARQQEQE